MKQLARTLLILGGVTACERAHPVVDHKERPAVGNIGQTGRPQQRPAAIASPLADPSGVPAVGNIGQTGAPDRVVAQEIESKRRERVRRLQRAQRTAPAIVASTAPAIVASPAPALVASQQPAVELREPVARPLLDERERPMVGNVMTKCSGATCERPVDIRARLAFETKQIAGPLLDRRERPAVANVVRGGKRPMRRSPSEILAAKIHETRKMLEDPLYDEEQRAAIRASLDEMTATYHQLEHLESSR